jgi:fervidolysin-like protein
MMQITSGRFFFAALTVVSLPWLPACTRDATQATSDSPATSPTVARHVPGEVIVQFHPGTAADRIAAIQTATGTRIAKELGMPLVYLLGYSGDLPVDEMIRQLKNYPEVMSAEPNRVIRLEPPRSTLPKKPASSRD